MQEFFQKKFKILKKFVFFQKNLKKFMKKQENQQLKRFILSYMPEENSVVADIKFLGDYMG